MKKTRRTAAQIIRMLGEADTGLETEDICRKRNMSAQSYYRWRSKYGGMEIKEAQRLRDLEKENAELKTRLATTSADRAKALIASALLACLGIALPSLEALT